jgi:hypothetical protein
MKVGEVAPVEAEPKKKSSAEIQAERAQVRQSAEKSTEDRRADYERRHPARRFAGFLPGPAGSPFDPARKRDMLDRVLDYLQDHDTLVYHRLKKVIQFERVFTAKAELAPATAPQPPDIG